MGKRGPRPMPTHLRLLRGNPSKEPLNKNEPQPFIEPTIPDAPKFLTGYAADEWYRISEELYRLKLLTSVDTHTLAAYCEAYMIWRTAVETHAAMADRDAVTHGLMVKNANGSAMQNPIVLTIRQAGNDMVRFAGEFGLSPAARSRISGLDDPSGPSSKFGRFLA
jgi:P27 family predicted phage terminase small subunit